ncbi:MAG: hypothetical protein BWX70_02622 [Verrucomicrobia bacterium ADurb.Bin070]|nr:MAG: hypothetical protein BWX70_02622 [Verrucomicrobia bacterium ADurb.Bin070]
MSVTQLASGPSGWPVMKTRLRTLAPRPVPAKFSVASLRRTSEAKVSDAVCPSAAGSVWTVQAPDAAVSAPAVSVKSAAPALWEKSSVPPKRATLPASFRRSVWLPAAVLSSRSVAPLATVQAAAEAAAPAVPERTRVPPLTARVPLKVLAAVRRHVPSPSLASETSPEPLTTAPCSSPSAAAELRSVRVLAPEVVEVVGAVKTSVPEPACSRVPPRLMSSVRSVVSPAPV